MQSGLLNRPKSLTPNPRVRGAAQTRGLPLCRPSGWTCLWRTIGNLSVLNRMICA